MTASDIPTGSIVVGVDGSEAAALALSWAARQAALEHRPLTLVHATVAHLPWSAPGIDLSSLLEAIETDGLRTLRLSAEEARKAHPQLEIVTLNRHADPRDALLDASRHAVLTVVGSRGRGRMTSLLLGSVSSALAMRSRTPVVVVRPVTAQPRGIVCAVDGRSASRSAAEFAFRHASQHRLPLSILHCFWDDGTGRDSARLLVSETVAGLAETFPDVDVKLELDPGRARDALVDHSDASHLVVVGRPHCGLRRILAPSVTAALLEHARGPVAVVPDDRD